MKIYLIAIILITSIGLIQASEENPFSNKSRQFLKLKAEQDSFLNYLKKI
jgi:hypothetical protein